MGLGSSVQEVYCVVGGSVRPMKASKAGLSRFQDSASASVLLRGTHLDSSLLVYRIRRNSPENVRSKRISVNTYQTKYIVLNDDMI